MSLREGRSMIKILHTGDLHIGREYKKQEQENREIAKKYRQARVQALENIVRIANEKSCDYLIIAGDLYDKKEISLSLQREVCSILNGYEGIVLVLPGNHDYYEGEDDKLWSRFLELAGENVILVRENKEIEMGEICFYPCICHDRYSQENALGWLKEEKNCGENIEQNISVSKKDQIKIGIAHGALEGLSYDKERKYYYMTREELEGCQMDLWLIGHTHIPYPNQEEIFGEKILNAGTHQPTDIADRAEGSVFLIELLVGNSKERKQIQERIISKESRNFSEKIHVRKIPTAMLHFEKREINLVHGEHLQEKIEKSIQGMERENTTLRLIISGIALEEEYEQRQSIYRSYEEQFLKFEVQDFELQQEITREKIEKETLEGSIENQLLMKYLDNPELLNLAFELIKSCKN